MFKLIHEKAISKKQNEVEVLSQIQAKYNQGKSLTE